MHISMEGLRLDFCERGVWIGIAVQLEEER